LEEQEKQHFRKKYLLTASTKFQRRVVVKIEDYESEAMYLK